jgi:hypothetical protein
MGWGTFWGGNFFYLLDQFLRGVSLLLGFSIPYDHMCLEAEGLSICQAQRLTLSISVQASVVFLNGRHGEFCLVWYQFCHMCFLFVSS